MNIDAQTLIAALQTQKQLGLTAAQAVAALTALPLATGGLDRHELSAVQLAGGLREVYAGAITALEIAIILHDLGYALTDIAMALRVNYAALAPLDTGTILLNPQVYPATPRTDLVTALVGAGYEAQETALACNILFPVTLTVQSTLAWQSTGLTVSGTQITTIAYQSGKWTANPANGMCDANGDAGQIAKPYYTLPGTAEGALIGRIGGNVFLVGNLGNAPAGVAGLLELCINDDLSARYGAGLADNQGSLAIKISTQAS